MEASGKHYLTCLWPGLPEMWFRGQLAALPAALTFALAVNFLLVARFIYPEWLAPLLVKLACWAAVGVWIYCVTKAVQRLPEIISPRSASDQPDRFAEAHIQYLRGHWVEAEALLSDCLEIESRDPPALLLLAGVYRHTNRLAAAANLLDQLERLERGDFWWLELQDERKRLQRFQAAATESTNETEPESESQSDPELLEAPAAEPAVAAEAGGETPVSGETETAGGSETTVESGTTGVTEVASKPQEPVATAVEELHAESGGAGTMQGAEADGVSQVAPASPADSPSTATDSPSPAADSLSPAADSLSAAATDQAFAAELAEEWPASDYSSPYRTV